MSKDDKRDPDYQMEIGGKFVLGLVACLITLSALIPTLLGIGLFLVLALLLRRTNPTPYRIGLAAATIASIVTFPLGAVGHYFMWLGGLFGLTEVSPTNIPLFALGAYSSFVATLIGALGVEWFRRRTPEKLAQALHLDQIDTLNVDASRAHKVASIAKPPTSLATQRSLSGTSQGAPDADYIILGVDAAKKPVKLYARDLSMHGMVLGTTGTGKTETLKGLIEGMLDLGYSGCVLDLKEDIGEGGLADFLETYSYVNGIEYQHWALSYAEDEYEFYLDPLTGLDQDLAANMIVSMQDFEAPHWEMMCKQILGQLLDLMYQSHAIAPEKFPTPNLRDVGRILSGDIHNDTQAMRAMVLGTLKPMGQRDESDYSTLTSPSAEHRQASKGLGARISAAYESSAGRYGLRPSIDRKPIRLADSGIVYIGLDSLGKADTSRVVSSAILGGYSALASHRKDDPRVKAKQDRRFLVIDEANAVNTQMTMNLLARARSAGIVVILATQGAIDWGDDWFAMVNNTNFSVIMGQQDPESARRAADLIGHAVRTDESKSLSDGEVVRTTLRDVEDHRVPLEKLRSLERGQAILRVRERFGAAEPYLTWLYVYLRKQQKEGFQTTADRRNRKARSAPFEGAIPDFGKPASGSSPLAPPPGITPPVPRVGGGAAVTTPPAPRQGAQNQPSQRKDDPPKTPPSGGWNPAI